MHLARGKARKKLWEIEDRLHCGIIGSCLTLEELRKLYRKTCKGDVRRINDYDIHTAFVGAASQPVPPTRLVQRLLESKYRRSIERYSGLTNSDDLAHQWRADRVQGQVPAAYWAVVSHPKASPELIREVHGEVHMLSHLVGASQRADLRRLADLEDESRELTARMSQLKGSYARRTLEKDEQIASLTRELQATQQRLCVLEKQVEEAANAALGHGHVPGTRRSQRPDPTAAQLTRRAEQAEQRAREWETLAKGAGDQLMQLQFRIDRAERERQALEAHIETLLSDQGCQSCDPAIAEKCPRLHGRCILYVGGVSRQMPHFRALVERQGGTLVHHDGGLHGGRARLAATMAGADAVMCALDRVSHDATLRVKRFCNRYAKPLVMLPSSGLSSFAHGLHEVAGTPSLPSADNGAEA